MSLKFQIHHIFPVDLFTGPIGQLLINADFKQEATGNKIGLLENQDSINILRNIPQIAGLLFDTGFGLTAHLGSHPSYTEFIRVQLERIRVSGMTDGNKQLAIADLHRFATNLSKGSITVDGNVLDAKSSVPAITAGWNDPNNGALGILSDTAAANLSDSQRIALDNHANSMGPETDKDTSANTQERYDSLKAFIEESISRAVLAGKLATDALDRLDKALATINSESGNIMSAFIGTLYDVAKKFGGDVSGAVSITAGLLGTNILIEKISAEIMLALGDAAIGLQLTFESVVSNVSAIFSSIKSFGNQLSNSISDFTPQVIETMGKNINSILVGVGGSIIGDIAEFLNEAYPAIKKGFQTEDWSDLGDVILKFGAAVVFSAVLVTATVGVAGFFAGPVGAAFAAAGFAAYGLYEAVTNGAELLGKIGSDIAEVIADINLDIEALLGNQQHADGLERLTDAITLIFAGARRPDDIAPHDYAYVADTNVAELPDFLEGTDESELFFGRNNAEIRAGGGVDEIHHSGYGEARGEEGNDFLRGDNPEYIFMGELLNSDAPEPAEGEPDLRERAEIDLRLTLDGGKGDDYVMAFGGTGAILVGGEGRDFLFNTSYKGQLWGDTLDGRDADGNALSHEGAENSDVFWYWPGTFIMDAQQNDILQMFGLPLLGGSNTFGGIPFGDGSWAVDWLNFFTFYTVRGDNQLVIHNALFDIITRGSDEYDILNSAMIVENYTFGGLADNVWGAPAAGDLGMTFRIVVPEGEGVEISVWNSVWGHLFTYLDIIGRFAKLLSWQPADDPLVLDLDGDGIETVSVDQSGVHFDLDGDYFAEKTGWVAADDGFLVRDLNGNGLIDDITEMFGAPGVSAYSELAELDKVENGGNADGFITLDDAAFSQLQVWRDLDQDGETDAGELFTLAELDIVSISVTGDGVESITPTGTTLREGASFTFGDGTTGNTYEALFETDASDTIFRGEKGMASNDNGYLILVAA